MPLPAVEHEIPGAYQIEALLHGRALQRAWHRARLDAAAVLLPPAAGTRSLDLAAGSGILTWRFPEARIASVDLRLDACRAIRAHTAGAQALVAELSALPVRGGAFDQVYFLETIEHLSTSDGAAVLREIRRVLNPRGRCLITTPNYRSHWVLMEWVLDRLHLTPPFAEGQHVSKYDRPSFRAIIESAGLGVERLGSFNLVAPIVGLGSTALGAAAVTGETRWAGATGALLYAVCGPRD